MAEVADKAKKEDPSVVAKADSKVEHPSNLCCYSQRVCHLEKLKGFDFCHKHILEDKASPFKPCDFVAKSNGRRCPNPAPKVSDRGKSFCIVHTRKAELRRAVEERRKRRHHEGDGEEGFDGDKEKRRRTSSSNSQKSDKPDGNSSDEEAAGGSGDDFLKVDSAWHGDLDSDADSVDSEEEDPLKHAGVWTVEEATRMCRDKMIRLRSLYIAQFKRLQHVLKERKRKYCQAIQAEEEEETGECHLTPTQLLGRKRQHERPGTEALLHKQAKEKKQGLATRQQGVSTLRCTYSPGGNRCAEKVVPLTKHCMKHITHDPNQLLFQKCTFTSQSDSQCERSIAKIFNHSVCKLHLELPPKMKRPDVKKDLEDAKERAKFRKARALEQKDKSDVPETLQQKSSALVPPTPASQSDGTVLPTTQPSQATKASHSSLTGGTSHVAEEEVKRIDVNVGGTNTDNTLSATSASTATPSASPSVASLSSPAPASESISPVLAAASLVAVCSSPQIPVQGTPLASVSGAKPVAELNALPGICSEKANSDAASSKRDVDSKPTEPAGESNVKDAKEAVEIDPKETASKPQEMSGKDSTSSAESKIASTVHNEKTGSLQNKTEAQAQEESNVAKGQDEVGVVPQASSQSVSQSIPQITPQVVVSPEISNASAKVVSPATLTSVSSGETCVTTKIFPQCSSSSSVVMSSSVKVTLQGPSENLSTVTSKGAPQGASNISIKVTPMKPVSREASESTVKVTSKTGLQGSSKGEAQKSTSPGVSSASHSVAKQATQGTSGGVTHLAVVTTASSSSCQPSKAKLSVTTETPRPAAVKAFQHLPSGMTASSSKQFSAITSVVTKEASKDSKTDLAKAQDQGDSAKL